MDRGVAYRDHEGNPQMISEPRTPSTDPAVPAPKRIRHGISLLPDCRPARRPAVDYYQDVLALARDADAGGLDYVKMTEHYLGDYGGYCPSPLTFLAAVAAQTSNIRLMTGCVLPAFHHPVQLAAHAAMVDVLSGGRLEVGFARAWLPYEFEAFGVPLSSSHARFQACIKAVIRLWTEQKVTEQTEFFSFRDATSQPAVVQRPHPPVWGAAIRSPESFVWLAEQGFGLLVSLPPLRRDFKWTRDLIRLYRATFAAKHKDTGLSPRVAVSIPLYVAPTDAEAYDTAIPHVREYLDVSAEAASSWTNVSSDNYRGYQNMSDGFATSTSEALRQEGSAVIGSPASVIEQIRGLHAELAPDVCLWGVDFGGQEGQTMRRSLKLFLDEVLPHVREL
jgi:alkanesulfonate monooxygenase SsuD/methylene tetrahydromethanopterin reductase-like flavin-dependent oxidoreductase (luciferase family)